MRFKFDMEESMKDDMLYKHWFNFKSRINTREYADVLFDHKWYKFSNFYKDLVNMFGSDKEGYVLDKDFLSDNRFYCKDTVCFIPKDLNSKIRSITNKKLDGLPFRVYATGRTYCFRVTVFGVKKEVGGFKTPELAFARVKKIMESYYKTLAILYKDQISKEVYNALRAYKVTPKGVVKPYIRLNYSKLLDLDS